MPLVAPNHNCDGVTSGRHSVTQWGGNEERASSSQELLVPPSVVAVHPSLPAASSGLYTHSSLSLKNSISRNLYQPAVKTIGVKVSRRIQEFTSNESRPLLGIPLDNPLRCGELYISYAHAMQGKYSRMGLVMNQS